MSLAHHVATASPRLNEALGRLDALLDWERAARATMRVDLAPITDLMERLDRPQRRFRSVHVTGTKGKGSVCAMVEAGLAHAGWTVGRYASPHLERINERICLNRRLIGDDLMAAALESAIDAREAACAAGTAAAHSTWFDVMTAAAYQSFAQAGIEWAVVEVGLGGRLDSTNVIDSDIAVVTNVGLEHTDVLGATIELIAAEKAGIVKPVSMLVTPMSASDSAGQVVHGKARSLGARTWPLRIPPGATILQQNLATARAVLDALGERGVRSKARSARLGAADLPDAVAQEARLPGRLERFRLRRSESPGESTEIVLDGAHVGFALAQVLLDLQAAPDLIGQPVVLLALGQDKDASTMLSSLASAAGHVVCTELHGGRASWDAGRLASMAATFGLTAEAVPDLHQALARGLELARGRWMLVTGSLHLVGAIRTHLRSASTASATE